MPDDWLWIMVLLPGIFMFLESMSRDNSHEQVIVFDAGSSGTRVHVFSIRPTEDSPSRAHVPRIDLDFSWPQPGRERDSYRLLAEYAEAAASASERSLRMAKEELHSRESVAEQAQAEIARANFAAKLKALKEAHSVWTILKAMLLIPAELAEAQRQLEAASEDVRQLKAQVAELQQLAEERGRTLRQICEEDRCETSLSHFAERDDLDGAKWMVHLLIGLTYKYVPSHRWRTTPVLLKATAGLRAVEARNASKAKAILRSVRQALGASRYQFDARWANIIGGTEEGGLAWVAVNYLEGRFNQVCSEGEPESTTGVIELGGASAQVAFQVGEADRLAVRDLFAFETALGKKYHVYAHSYQGFGQDQVQRDLRERMKRTETEDPCYPRGYVRNGSGALIITGAGDWRRCKANIEKRVLRVSRESPGRYADELPLSGSFVATVNFFHAKVYVMKEALRRTTAAQNLTQRELQDTVTGRLEDVVKDSDVFLRPRLEEDAEATCSSELPPGPEAGTDPNLPKWCFALTYQALLLQALQVQARGIQVRIKSKINKRDIDWALGAALMHYLQASKLAPGRPSGAALDFAQPFAVPPIASRLGIEARPQGERLRREEAASSASVHMWLPFLIIFLAPARREWRRLRRRRVRE